MTRAWLVLPLLAGCAETAAPAVACERPAEIAVSFVSGALLNPDEAGGPLPTEVRVVELRDALAFEDASFDDVWSASPALDAVVASQSTTLYPGETTGLAVTPGAETRAVALVAVVRRPAGRTWRTVVPVETLPCGARAALVARVDEYRIERDPESR